MTAPTPTGPVLVGIVDGQRPEVLRTAARVAADAGAALLLVSVSADPYLVGEYVDPMTGGIPLGFVGAAADRGADDTARGAAGQRVAAPAGAVRRGA
ncbi:hypothetical protein C5D38_05520, partial [Rathayibacter sp. TRS19]